MKVDIAATMALLAVGAVAAPSWTWKEGTAVEKYLNNGKDIYFCSSGWEHVGVDDVKYGLTLKREAKHGSDDGPNHDRHDDHGKDGS